MKKTYLKPSVKVEEAKIEKGFAGSIDSQFGDVNQAGGSLTEDEWVEF